MFVLPMTKIGIAVGVVALGTAGVILLTSDDAKKVYTKVTAAALRAGDAVKDSFVGIADSCREILDDAMDYNAERAAAKEDAAVAEAWEEDAEDAIPAEEGDAPAEDAPEDAPADEDKTEE